MATIEDIFKHNEAWVKKMTADDPNYFATLSRDQQPDYFYIGCADSRVPPNEIMGLEPGDIFVHRNVANLVNNTDLNVMTSVNYAVRHLKVKHIIVCGHYNCGGVKAAMQPQDLGILNPWLRGIRDVYRLHKAELDAIKDQGQRFDRLVELNVIEQCTSILKTAAVQLALEDRGAPDVYGFVFDLRTGRLKDLEIDYKGILKEIQEIYNLTGHDVA